MSNGAYAAPHSNPVWSTFVFIMCMLLFLFYLETMIRPMDYFVARSYAVLPSKNRHRTLYRGNRSTILSRSEVLTEGVDWNSSGDVLVYLHIPKTGGKAFGAHLALDFTPDSGPVCECGERTEGVDNVYDVPGVCSCLSEDDTVWLHNRLTVFWPCGVHAGLTDLSPECLDKELNHRDGKSLSRRYAIVTTLREPISRYISEWQQIATHDQWRMKKIHCHPLHGTDNLYFNGNWSGVSFADFLNCPANPGSNRMTRMLSDFSNIDCSLVNKLLLSSETSSVLPKNNSLLENAKHNLKKMPFFGLTEYPSASDALFEHTFGVTFKIPLSVSNAPVTSEQSRDVITDAERQRVVSLNGLDVELYNYAKKLFFERISILQNFTNSTNHTMMFQ